MQALIVFMKQSMDEACAVTPRRRSGMDRRKPVVLTRELIESYFTMPLSAASRDLVHSISFLQSFHGMLVALAKCDYPAHSRYHEAYTHSATQGLCATAIKKVCRKFSIAKWPYRDRLIAQKKNEGHLVKPADGFDMDDDDDDADIAKPQTFKIKHKTGKGCPERKYAGTNSTNSTVLSINKSSNYNTRAQRGSVAPHDEISTTPKGPIPPEKFVRQVANANVASSPIVVKTASTTPKQARSEAKEHAVMLQESAAAARHAKSAHVRGSTPGHDAARYANQPTHTPRAKQEQHRTRVNDEDATAENTGGRTEVYHTMWYDVGCVTTCQGEEVNADSRSWTHRPHTYEVIAGSFPDEEYQQQPVGCMQAASDVSVRCNSDATVDCISDATVDCISDATVDCISDAIADCHMQLSSDATAELTSRRLDLRLDLREVDGSGFGDGMSLGADEMVFDSIDMTKHFFMD